MSSAQVSLEVIDESQAAANASAKFIEDAARGVDGILSVNRTKADPDSMDLGSIIEVVFASGATLAFARGLAAWLKARRGARVVIKTDKRTGSIKTIVEGIDPATAERIVELHVG